MNNWKKMGLIVLAVSLAAGARLYFVFKERSDPGVLGRQAEAAKPVPKDDLVDMRQLYFANFDDSKQLEGKPVWIKAGYSLPYFPYVDERVEFAKRLGVLPATEKLDVAKVIKAVAPANVDDRVPHGSRQYLITFSMTGADGQPVSGLFAAPIGYVEGNDEKFYADQLFYYDDPRMIYDHWPLSVWQAVAIHEPKVGMSENQVRMALGIMMESNSQSVGDRIVTYHLDGKKWTVTFANGVATSVKPG